MEEDMRQQVQQLLDERACEKVLMRYGRTLDWLDHTGQQDCFWPDAEVDYGFFRGSGSDWVPLVMNVEAGSARRWHMTTGVTVHVQGDAANSESYALTVGASRNAQGNMVDTLFGGRYLDELQRRDGRWRISKRSYVADWSHKFPDGLEELAERGFDLNVLAIDRPGHDDYREMQP